MPGAPRSEIFDDIYFSPEDGVAESRYVFLEGNGLPGAWRGRARFTICETGFGTGLNFLLAADLFGRTANGQRLDYRSFEKYPLTADDIGLFLMPLTQPSPNRGEGGARCAEGAGSMLAKLVKKYPLRIPGFHPLEFGPVRLVLMFDDVNKALPELDASVDAWFLDGFAPSKNPDMWSETLFKEMARLSGPGASFATFTAAGVVKRGLAAAGFHIERIKGFGQKKHMLKGTLISPFPSGEGRGEGTPQVQKIAIVGAGLAGTACAWLLRKHGVKSVIFEASQDVAGGASGNATGIFNPRFSQGRTAESEFYSSAYALAIRTMQELSETNDIGYRRLGSLHLVNSPEKQKRFRSVAESWGWHSDHMRYVDSDEASRVAHVKVPHEALYLPDSGSVSPASMCAAYADGIDVKLGVQLMVGDIERVGENWRVLGEEYDAIILACGEGAKWFRETSWLPVHTVRGQIIQVEDSGFADDLVCNICYGGYISPGESGVHTLGSTFQKWLTTTDIREEDNDEIIARFTGALPRAEDVNVTPTAARAGLRTASQDHFPIAGSVPDLTSWKLGQDKDVPNLYLTTAHGSHGIVSSIAAATLVTDRIVGRAPGLSVPVIEALSASRFLKRARKKGQLDRFQENVSLPGV
ncbi:MAG: FAD-dependent oxidoreductase [Alphaproteobacteria bacterium]|nr:FAD-dependent oxidoreductase [Alphaproteobacteria bacterium]